MFVLELFYALQADGPRFEPVCSHQERQGFQRFTTGTLFLFAHNLHINLNYLEHKRGQQDDIDYGSSIAFLTTSVATPTTKSFNPLANSIPTLLE